ncbi:MAG: hypothetical protein C4534_10705 [Gaiellales bacterium]|nr:MAG: hypothetical protein C4534_10705 [Gaiellales bacterium]
MRTPETASPVEKAAFACLLLALALALFYPESFILPQPEIAGFRVVPLTWVTPIIALVTVVSLFIRRKSLRFAWTDAAMLAFFAFVIVRTAVSGFELPGAFKYFILGAGAYYLAAVSLSKPRLREAFLWFIAVIVLIIAAYGFLEFALQKNHLFHDHIARIVVEREDGVHRSGSTLAHPVVYGAVLVQIIPLLALMWLRAGSHAGRVAGGIASMVSITAVVLTFSKGSWIAVSFYGAALLLTLLYRRPAGGLKVIIASLAVAITALVVFWRQIYQETLVRSEESALVRLATWQGAVEAIRERPWIGYGFRQGRKKLEMMDVGQKYYEMTSRAIPVDNNYLSLLLDLGVAGFILWLAFLGAVAASAIGGMLSGRHDEYWLAAILASMVGLAVTALTFEAWISWPTFMLFMACAGTVSAIVRSDPPDRR